MAKEDKKQSEQSALKPKEEEKSPNSPLPNYEKETRKTTNCDIKNEKTILRNCISDRTNSIPDLVPSIKENENNSEINFKGIQKNSTIKKLRKINTNKMKKILVVDNAITINDYITNLLRNIIDEKNMRNEVIQCFDGVDLVSEVFNDQKNGNLIDLIIVDENMDFINGTEAIGILRRIERDKQIKLPYIVSSTNDEGVKQKLNSLNVTKIIPKPINKNSMVNVMKELKIIK